ncbi:MAG: FHA domain-containing protein [Chloroflexi bacterium]|nr:MAG: FHA domain-containing protein [Chloroflexota bacterium]
MKICPHCGTENREGVYFCEACARALEENIEDRTRTVKLQGNSTEMSGKATWGTARFGSEAAIIIHIRDAAEPLVLHPAVRTVLGRADTTSKQQPDLDLTPFGALEKGVSRIHAAIERSEDTLTIVDMGSVNGTHLNGQRLIPEQPRVLRDGDEIRFGKLVTHIYFK